MSLEVRSIVASYTREQPVVKDVSFGVEAGQLAAVLGPSGSGKTTLLRVLAGLHRQDSGDVLCAGESIGELPAHKRKIGLVPQEGALFPHLNVVENIAYGLRLKEVTRRDRASIVAELLAMVDLEEYGKAMPHELSGGQQQRVALARALAPKPQAILLDEPFAALDASLRHSVRSSLIEIVRSQGIPAVLITHDQQEALTLADELVLLKDGEVRQNASPEICYSQPEDAWVARFLGQCAVLEGTSLGGVAETALGLVQLGTPAPLGDVLVIVRPDQLCWSSSDTGIPVEITKSEYLGYEQLWSVVTAEGVALALRSTPNADLSGGSKQRVEVNTPLGWVPSEPLL